MTHPVSLLSTLNTNIGDEFIRDGVVSLLLDVASPEDVDLRIFNKHAPWTLLPSWHPAQAMRGVKALFDYGWRKGFDLLSGIPGHRMRDSDLVIQAGTPVVWDGASSSEWAAVFWKHLVFRYGDRLPVANLGAGSCYPWSSPPEKLEGRDRVFFSQVMQYTRLTVARDPLAAALLSEVSGQEIPVLPCPAFLAGQAHVTPSPADRRILFNCMPLGGHFDYLGEVDPQRWVDQVADAIAFCEQEYQVELICHGEAERVLAGERWPHLPCHSPATPKDYFELVQGARAAVVNRLHAAVGMAGLGIPSIAVGTDTRLLMTKEVGLPSLFAPEVTRDGLITELELMLDQREARSSELLRFREEVFAAYRELLKPLWQQICAP